MPKPSPGQRGDYHGYAKALIAKSGHTSYSFRDEHKFPTVKFIIQEMDVPPLAGQDASLSTVLVYTSPLNALYMGDIMKVSHIKKPAKMVSLLDCTNGADLVYAKGVRGYQVTSAATATDIDTELRRRFSNWHNISFSLVTVEMQMDAAQME